MIDQDTTKRRVDQIREGDLIDLEGDLIADPTMVDGRFGNDEFRYEFAEVAEIEHERKNSTVLHTSQGSFAFPPWHEIPTAPRGV